MYTSCLQKLTFKTLLSSRPQSNLLTHKTGWISLSLWFDCWIQWRERVFVKHRVWVVLFPDHRLWFRIMSSIPPIDSQVGTNITYYGNLGHVNNDKNILVRDACCSVRLAAGGCVGRDCVETVLNCVQTSPAVIGGPPMIITHTPSTAWRVARVGEHFKNDFIGR